MADNDSVLAKAAKAVGKAAGKVAGKTATAAPAKAVPQDLYKAEYVGSGTFKIKKPKRNSRKTHQSRVKNDRGGRI
jgi:hypothetical protein